MVRPAGRENSPVQSSVASRAVSILELCAERRILISRVSQRYRHRFRKREKFRRDCDSASIAIAQNLAILRAQTNIAVLDVAISAALVARSRHIERVCSHVNETRVARSGDVPAAAVDLRVSFNASVIVAEAS